MSTTPATSFSSRSGGPPSGPWLAVLLCCLAFIVTVFAPIPAQATLSDYAKASKVIAPRLTAQVPFGEPVKLEIAARFFGGNDPINRHDPLGLSSIWDTTLIEGGWVPLAQPYNDPATGNVMVKMRHIVALTLGMQQGVASDSVMPLAQAKRLSPYSSMWLKSLPSRTLLSGTGFQSPEFSDISSYMENHPGWNAELGVMESAPFALGGGYVFGGVRAVIGARAAGYLGSGLLGMSLGDWANNGFKVTPRGVGQFLGGLPAGGGLLAEGEAHGAAGMRALANAFAPQRLTMGVGELMANGELAGMGPGAAFTGEFGPREILVNMARKTPKIDYLFSDRNDAMNWARQKLGLGATRVYSDSGQWIGWSNNAGNEIYWGHGDWGQGMGSSTFPHINYEMDGVSGHLFLENKIRNRGMWDDFTTYFNLTE